ncbi:MAG: hypothetical protein V7756_04190 [Halopseudomonas sp.]|uniref:baeRF3 domain-containing protein n=1 Tax=Halopseudomonas sp. TaxID=2901191 RepID=UPI003001CD4F
MSAHITRDNLTELINYPRQICLSLYMPTYRAFPDSSQNITRYKNLLGQLREQLPVRFPDAYHATMLAPFERLEQDHDFWQTPRDGLAVLCGEMFFQVYKLSRPVTERVVVDDQPCLSPLLTITQARDLFQILCLSRDHVRLLEGHKDGLHAVELDPRVPQTQNDALGTELTSADQSGHPDGFGPAGERGDSMMHAAGGPGKQAEIDKDREKFFRAVDRAIEEHHSKPSGLPLLLVALPENQSFFRQVSHNQRLLEERLEIDPGALDAEAIRERVAETMAHREVEQLNEVHDKYGAAQGENRTSEDLREVGKAALAGRIATLLVEADRSIPGALDQDSGEVGLNEDTDANLLEDITLCALRNGAEVLVVSGQRMPTTSGVAAIFHF